MNTRFLWRYFKKYCWRKIPKEQHSTFKWCKFKLKIISNQKYIFASDLFNITWTSNFFLFFCIEDTNFSNDVITEFHNVHQWETEENPIATTKIRHQRTFSFFVWIGIIVGNLIESFPNSSSIDKFKNGFWILIHRYFRKMYH